MLEGLDGNRILHAGAGQNAEAALEPAIATLPDGRHVALLSFLGFVGRGALLKCTPATQHSAGVNALNTGGVLTDDVKTKLERLVRAARTKADFVIVAIHWGIERKTLPTPYQVNLGRAFIDAGADIVWGHHPHVLEGAELYRGKPILYSMGNLVAPLPSPAGLVKLSFLDQNRLECSFIPCHIASGRMAPSGGKSAEQISGVFRSLCNAIQRRYRNPNSHSLLSQGPAPKGRS
jgi:poly-gamma-glutamate synthesis protein (capsule biosynthesis protein)